MLTQKQKFSINSVSGFSLLEILVGMICSMVMFLGLTALYMDTSRRAYDLQVKNETDERALELTDMITGDLRAAGSGMPLGQAAFSYTDTLLGDAPKPILTGTDANTIVFRMSDYGDETVLTSDYAPSTTNLTFTVASATGFQNGDIIYISDMVRGGSEAMKATITAVTLATNTITISNAYTKSTGSTFSAGSTVSRVTQVTWEAPTDWSGVTRDGGDGSGAQLVMPNAQVTFAYYTIENSLIDLSTTTLFGSTGRNYIPASIQVSSSVRSRVPLRDGTTYTASISTRVALRPIVWGYGW